MSEAMEFGYIAGFSHTPGSGLVTLFLDTEEGYPEAIHGDNSSMARIAENFKIGEKVGVTYPDNPWDGPHIHKLEVTDV